MAKDLLFLQLDVKSDDLTIASIYRISVYSLRSSKKLIDCHFGRCGMNHQQFAPIAKPLLLLLKNNIVVSLEAQKTLSLLKKAYALLSFKL